MTTKKARILSVEKAVNILNLFKSHEKLTLNEISKLMEIPKTTAFSLIATLENMDMLTFDCVTGRYTLGINIVELFNSINSNRNIRDEARKELRKLSDQYQKNTHITMLSGRHIIYVESIVPAGAMAVTTVVGAKAPANCTSSGKAFLAYTSQEELNKVLSEPLEGLTLNSILDTAVLRKELDGIRKDGYAVDNEESILGVKGVGTVVVDQWGKPVLGISIAGLASYITPSEIEIFSQKLKEIAKYLSNYK
ncbi:MAG: IclR family transcriptional regulator [Lachnospiraceae bacterium]|nr:IclR family transcriptional regulator [Lachnospiraceae bacterium]